MSFVVALGWLAAVVGACSAIPQMVRLLRARTSAGLSLLLWQVTFGVSLVWIAHGLFVIPATNIVAPNALMGVFAAIILVTIVRDRRLNPLTSFGVPTVLAAALVATDVWLGPVVMGVLISIPQLVGAISQFRELLRAPDISGISGVFLAWMVVVQVLWFSWALLVRDPSLVLAAGSYGAFCLLNLVWWSLRRTGLVRAPRAPLHDQAAGPEPSGLPEAA